ncbi:unnamed protein product [Clonostachys byssicola]|uniref:FAD-binding PCMH-type domain-containing protein n=1 Tax=Clonostachys byssicola TaxID=160290 RepID=A0A9N9Y5L2_9HYPO|nr:unnamed protein product [Clonostachys byssicola]
MWVFLGFILLTLASAQCADLAPNANTQPSVAVSAVKACHGNQVALPGTSLYEEVNESYLSRLNSELRPLAILLPETTAQVANFVRILKPFALLNIVPFAVRGGGQQPAVACNNIQSGITIDLRNVTGVNVDTKKGTVTVGSGERWGAVYEVLEPLGLGVAGGRSTTNGINGLALAGGLSFFSSREGFISDNVVNFEVVLESGKVVNANAKENSDLYKALRGGGNNFGVVTRVTLRTFKQGKFYGGSVFYFPQSWPSQIDALVTELTKPNADPETHIMLSTGYSKAYESLGGTLCLNQLYYTKEANKPAVLQPFESMQPQIDAFNTMRNLTLVAAASEQTSQNAASTRAAYMNVHVKADVATLLAATELYNTGIEPLKNADNITLSFTLQPYAVSLLQKTSFQGGNSLGLSPSDGPIVSVLFLTWWTNKADDDRIISTLKGILGQIDADAKSRGTSLNYIYMNYAHNFQDPITSYGANNKNALQKVSTKYDPQGLFQRGVPGGFKLWR